VQAEWQLRFGNLRGLNTHEIYRLAWLATGDEERARKIRNDFYLAQLMSQVAARW
jgi:hypothetical protein